MKHILGLALGALAGCTHPMAVSAIKPSLNQSAYIYRNALNQQVTIDLRAMTLRVGDKVHQLQSCSTREGVKCVEAAMLKIVAPAHCDEATFSHLTTLEQLGGVKFISLIGGHGAASYSASPRSAYMYDPYNGVTGIYFIKPVDRLQTYFDPLNRPREVFALIGNAGPFGCFNKNVQTNRQ